MVTIRSFRNLRRQQQQQQQQQADPQQTSAAHKNAFSEENNTELDLQLQLLENLKLRSEANEKRLQNEITLVMSTFCCMVDPAIYEVVGVQYNHPTRQQSHDGNWKRRSVGQYRDEDDRRCHHGFLACDVHFGKYWTG
jgi:hypothetical protein